MTNRIIYLRFEDLDITTEQILPLHTLLSGQSADEESGIDILESFLNVVSGHNIYTVFVLNILQVLTNTGRRTKKIFSYLGLEVERSLRFP